MGRAAITTWAGLVALAAIASAQTTQGLISGRVVDLGSGRAIVSAEIRCDANKRKDSKRGGRLATIIEEEIMSLSVEAKVAIAVTTSFLMLIVGAMAQG